MAIGSIQVQVTVNPLAGWFLKLIGLVPWPFRWIGQERVVKFMVWAFVRTRLQESPYTAHPQ